MLANPSSWVLYGNKIQNRKRQILGSGTKYTTGLSSSTGEGRAEPEFCESANRRESLSETFSFNVNIVMICRRLRNLRPLLFLLFLGISLFVWEKILAFELGFCFLTRNYKRVRRWEDESPRQQSTGEKKVRWGSTRTWFPSFPPLLSFKSRHFLFAFLVLYHWSFSVSIYLGEITNLFLFCAG